MKTLKEDWLISIMLLIPFVFIAIFWNQFPDTIPTHFDMSGKPNGWSDKVTGLFMMSGINVVLYFVLLLAPKIDPAKANYPLFKNVYRTLRIVIHTFITFIFFIAVLPSLGYEFNNAMMMVYGLLALFLVLGNYMGNVRHNYFIGVRTPWTLANEVVWTKTHRLTAKLWVFSSLAMMLIIPFVPDPDFALMPYMAIIVLVPVVYSFIEFKKQEKNEN